MINLFSLFFSMSGCNGMLFGAGDINVPQDKDYACKVFPFDPDFPNEDADVRVQLAVTSKKYEAAVTWVGETLKTG